MEKKQKNDSELDNKLDLIIKLLGVIATQGDFPQKKQEAQIVEFYKMGFRNKDISCVLGIRPQQVNNAILKTKKRKKKN